MAETLRPTDTQRLARALEVVRSTGRSLGEWQREREPGPLSGLRLERRLFMPDRAELHARIEARARRIVSDERAIEEVRALLVADPERCSAVAKAIGVEELRSLVEGTGSPENAISKLTVATRRYAKRQFTWFGNSLTGDWQIRNL